MKTMKVEFTETRIVNDFRKGTSDEEKYVAGEIYDLPMPSARRWIARGVAIIVPEVKKAKPKKEEKSFNVDIPVPPEEPNTEFVVEGELKGGEEAKRRGRPPKA